MRIAQQFGDAWQDLRLEIEEIIGAGDHLVPFTNMTRLSMSGIKLGQSVGQVWTSRDGKIVRDRFFGEDRAACLEAVGLSG